MRFAQARKNHGPDPGWAGHGLLGASRMALLLWGSRGALGSAVTAGEQALGAAWTHWVVVERSNRTHWKVLGWTER